MAKRMLMKKMGSTKRMSPKLTTSSAMYRKGGVVKPKGKGAC